MEDWAISSENIMIDICDLVPYSVGAFLGNGSVCYSNHTYVTEISSPDPEVAERCLLEMEILFNRKYKLVEYQPKHCNKPMFYARAYCKEVYDFYMALTFGKQEIPNNMHRAMHSSRLNFIAGMFDTDGTVKNTYNANGIPRWQVGFSNTKLNLVAGLAAILQNLGVKVGSIGEYKRANYLTLHSIFPNIRSFIEAGCYFHSKRKQQRLQDYLNHVVGSETLYTASMTMDEDKVQQ